MNMQRRTGRSILMVVAMTGFMALSGQLSAQTSAPSVITIKNFMFSPASLTVGVGSTVTWTNADEEPHTIVSDSGLFRSNAVDTKESFSFKFDKPGTYRFFCSIHPQMVGTIIVK